jgi:transcriptional regulator with XRE-family HTH domain
MKLVVPDGKRIAELRREKRMKQVALAHDSGISDRLLRDIENKNRGVGEHHLVNIANALGVQPNSIRKVLYLVKTEDDGAPDITATRHGFMRMRLKPIDSAGHLFRMSNTATWMNYELLVDPTKESAAAIIDFLSIVKAKVGDEWGFNDGYSSGNFPDIMRMARLGELIAEFDRMNIIVLANIYRRRAWKNDYDGYRVVPEIRLHLCICPVNTGERYVFVEDDDEEAKKRASRYADLDDDDFPF